MSLDHHRILTTALLIAGAAILIVLERRFPYNAGQRFFRRGIWSDFVFYGILQSYVLGWIISLLIDWIDAQTGWSRLQWIGDWPAGWQFVFFLVTHDLYIYWFHRWQHRSAILWRLHEAHHSTRDVDWLSGARSHSLEILINQTVEFAPIVLLGAAPEIALYKGLIDAVWGMYIHSNIDVRSGRLQWIVNGPEMHRWHHSLGDDRARNRNFSTKLAVWDWMFGTAYKPEGIKAASYGIGNPFPENYFVQQAYAFRPLASESPKQVPATTHQTPYPN
jgi:sterol desaturase/sphingolipid hydroxylase (fatty acid hydroxylase superfamily)